MCLTHLHVKGGLGILQSPSRQVQAAGAWRIPLTSIKFRSLGLECVDITPSHADRVRGMKLTTHLFFMAWYFQHSDNFLAFVYYPHGRLA